MCAGYRARVRESPHYYKLIYDTPSEQGLQGVSWRHRKSRTKRSSTAISSKDLVQRQFCAPVRMNCGLPIPRTFRPGKVCCTSRSCWMCLRVGLWVGPWQLDKTRSSWYARCRWRYRDGNPVRSSITPIRVLNTLQSISWRRVRTPTSKCRWDRW